jgi:hypothetical protein
VATVLTLGIPSVAEFCPEQYGSEAHFNHQRASHTTGILQAPLGIMHAKDMNRVDSVTNCCLLLQCCCIAAVHDSLTHQHNVFLCVVGSLNPMRQLEKLDSDCALLLLCLESLKNH